MKMNEAMANAKNEEQFALCLFVTTSVGREASKFYGVYHGAIKLLQNEGGYSEADAIEMVNDIVETTNAVGEASDKQEAEWESKGLDARTERQKHKAELKREIESTEEGKAIFQLLDDMLGFLDGNK